MKLPTDPTIYAIPFFLLLLAAEVVVLRRRRRRLHTGAVAVGYSTRDSVASISMGLGSIVIVGALHVAVFGIGVWLWQYRLFTVGSGWVAFAAAMLAWDFTFYWEHRFEHTVRFGWASHVNHHSSQHYNLSTALRQEWTPFIQLVMFPVWALLGIRPDFLAISGGINLIYQYWIHTETIDRLPRWFEYVLNTPSHHRVHHGSNQRYLDRNYGGILILWDRWFGTFQTEDEPVVYGLTKNISTYNPLRIAFHEWASMLGDVRRASSARDALGYLVRPPGWTPTPPAAAPSLAATSPAPTPTPAAAPSATAPAAPTVAPTPATTDS